MSLTDDQIETIEQCSSYFSVQNNGDQVELSTRRNGDVAEETYGNDDVREAKDVAKTLNDKLDDVSIAVHAIDEWVDVTISAEPLQRKYYRPCFAFYDNAESSD